jgi:cytoskeletal protein CcmA (bactofilin family)
MVFRRENKAGDAFQRQISALRQQLGADASDELDEVDAERTDPVEVSADRHPYPPPSSSGSVEPAPPAQRAYGFTRYGNDDATVAAPADAAAVAASPTPPALLSDDVQVTVIAHDTVWKGELTSEGSIAVHGRYEGSIRARNDVYVAEEADVDATVTAEKVIIAGLVKGTIRCGTRFEVMPTGRVTGDVQAPTFVVHEGAVVSGQFRMGPLEPAEQKPAPVVHRRAARGSA